MATSTPRRMPPSTRSVARPSIASTTSGSASAVASAAVELAAAVVGDDDPGGAVLERQLRVLGGEQALDEDGDAAFGGEVLDVGPGQGVVHQSEGLLDRQRLGAAGGGGEARRAELLRQREAVAAVALAVAAGRRVGGDEDRLEAGLDRLVHQRPGDACVLEGVELEPVPALRRGGGDLGRAGRRERREAHHRAGRRGAAPPSRSRASGCAIRW